MSTTHRPAPLPQHANAAPSSGVGVPQGPRRQPPAGAVKMARTWLDKDGVPQKSTHDVPVDANDTRTDHVLHTCRGEVLIDGVRQPCDHDAWLLPDAKARHCPDHGCQLTADGATTKKRGPWLPWSDIREALQPAGRAAAVVAGVGAIGAVVAESGAPWWAVPAGSFAAVPAAYLGAVVWQTSQAKKRGDLTDDEVTGRRLRERIARRARIGAYCTATACAWTELAAAVGVDPHTSGGTITWAALAVAGAIASGTWLRYVAAERARRRQAEHVPVTPETSPTETPQSSVSGAAAAQAATDWQEHVALAGTKLDPDTWKTIPCGWQAVVVATKRGALAAVGGDNMKALTRRLAGAFNVPKSAITWIEEHDDNPNQALLLVQSTNPLKEGQIWAGPNSIRITDSRIEAEVGRMIDGSPMTEVLFRFGQGAPSALTLGTTGSGKSERLRLKLVIERWTSFVDPATGQRRGLFLSFLHDPKQLESFAEFRDAVHGYGITRDDAHIMIDAFLREMRRRYDFLRSLKWTDNKPKPRQRRGGIKWNPLVHGPLISVIWDEFHEMAADAEFAKKQEKLARYQRACGMRAEIASHMGTLGDTASQALRDMVAGGRATMLRTTSALNAGLATGGQLVGDPRALPRDPGMCLVADGEAQSLIGRHAWIPGDDAGFDVTLYDFLFDEDNNPIGFPAEIPPETAEAFGREFMEWAAAGRSEEGRADSSMWLAPAPRPVDTTAGDQSALDALLATLATSTAPMARAQIAEHPLWKPRAVTSTLTKALKDAQTATPPMAVKVDPAGSYELTTVARHRLAQQAETRQLALDEVGAAA